MWPSATSLIYKIVSFTRQDENYDTRPESSPLKIELGNGQFIFNYAERLQPL